MIKFKLKMMKKMLAISFVLGLLILSIYSQIQIRSLKIAQEEINTEIKSEITVTPKKLLLDQVREDTSNRGDTVLEQDEPSVSDNQVNLKDTFDQKCDEEQVTYNSCLIRYNTELLEYQNCQSGSQTFGCSPSSYKPSNSCALNVSSWCRKQILGYY